jgi:hypothetical protein
MSWALLEKMMAKGYRFSLQVLHAGDGYFVGWGLMHWFLTLPDVAYYAIGEETLLPMYYTAPV